jgi:hypothetical protein
MALAPAAVAVELDVSFEGSPDPFTRMVLRTTIVVEGPDARAQRSAYDAIEHGGDGNGAVDAREKANAEERLAQTLRLEEGFGGRLLLDGKRPVIEAPRVVLMGFEASADSEDPFTLTVEVAGAFAPADGPRRLQTSGARLNASVRTRIHAPPGYEVQVVSGFANATIAYGALHAEGDFPEGILEFQAQARPSPLPAWAAVALLLVATGVKRGPSDPAASLRAGAPRGASKARNRRQP